MKGAVDLRDEEITKDVFERFCQLSLLENAYRNREIMFLDFKQACEKDAEAKSQADKPKQGDKQILTRTQIEEGERKLVKINGRLHHHRSILELKRQVYGETYQEIEATENQIRSEQRNRESILEELKKCELEIVEHEQQVQLIRERIRDHYDEEISKTLQVEKDEVTLSSDIERTKQSIERIGPVNMAVQLEV